MITSTHNQRVTAATRLKKRAVREKDRHFLVEGAQAVHEAIRSGKAIRELFYTRTADEKLEPILQDAAGSGIATSEVSDQVMEALTSTVTPQGVVAVAEFLDVPLSEVISAEGVLPVLVEVRDPGNAGTIFRSADASGASGMIFTPSSVDVYNPKTVRATAGSLFHVPVAREAGLQETIDGLREHGFGIYAADAKGTESIYDTNFTGPSAVLFGNEAHGLPSEVAAAADKTVRVPISGPAESLNLAAAATLVLFEAARQRVGGRSDSLADIVAGAAHDIRSPLTALGGFASTLISRWDRLNDQQRLQMLEGIVHDAARMNVIITQLVDAARIASRTLTLAPVPTDLRDAVAQINQEFTKWSMFEVQVSGESAPASVDGPRLRTILLAVIEAANWWGEEGPVHVVTAPGPPPFIRVRRSGTSLGLPEARALLQPRAPGTGGGSKAGLYVAKGLTEAHGGELGVEVDGAISFIVRLPPA